MKLEHWQGLTPRCLEGLFWNCEDSIFIFIIVSVRSPAFFFFFLRFWAQSLVDLQSLVPETKLPIEMFIDTEEHLRIKTEISHQLEVRLSFRPFFPTSMILSPWVSRAHIKLSPSQIFPQLVLYSVLLYNHLHYIPTSNILPRLILMVVFAISTRNN